MKAFNRRWTDAEERKMLAPLRKGTCTSIAGLARSLKLSPSTVRRVWDRRYPDKDPPSERGGARFGPRKRMVRNRTMEKYRRGKICGKQYGPMQPDNGVPICAHCSKFYSFTTDGNGRLVESCACGRRVA